MEIGRPRYPRVRIPTDFPSASNFSAIHRTMGVLPVPPAVRFPTLITTASNLPDFSKPVRYAHERRWFAAPYRKETGHSVRSFGLTRRDLSRRFRSAEQCGRVNAVRGRDCVRRGEWPIV